MALCAAIGLCFLLAASCVEAIANLAHFRKEDVCVANARLRSADYFMKKMDTILSPKTKSLEGLQRDRISKTIISSKNTQDCPVSLNSGVVVEINTGYSLPKAAC